MKYEEIEGDLIQLALAGTFDVIGHGCNCQCIQAAGIAAQMAENFQTDEFHMEGKEWIGDVNKLGQIEFEHFEEDTNEELELTVVNCYTQYNPGRVHRPGDKIPLDYDALRMCMRKLNWEFKDCHIGLPAIGCGLAKGDWNEVKKIIQEEITDCDVTIVHFKK